MAVNLSPLAGAGWQFFDNNGVILSGGLLYTYAAGTTTPRATYTGASGIIANPNPIVLDASGRVIGETWLITGQAYKFVLQTSTGTTIATYDGIPGINDNTSVYATFAASGGSALIGYLPAVGAATTVQTELRALDASVATFALKGVNADITSMTALTTLTALTTIPNGTVSNLPSVASLYRNLQVSTTGTSAPVTVTADEIVLSNSSNQYVVNRTVSLSISGATSGANGLDTGTIATSTWYSVWVIWNGTTTTTAGLLSLSATAPTLPSGYTHKARVGWMRTDATANKYPLSFTQFNRRVQYRPKTGGNLTAFPQMATGTASTTAVAWANYCPSTTSAISVALFLGANAYGGVASNNDVAIGGTAFASPLYANGAGTGSAQYNQVNGVLNIELSNIYWSASVANAGTNVLACIGWEDNI